MGPFAGGLGPAQGVKLSGQSVDSLVSQLEFFSSVSSLAFIVSCNSAAAGLEECFFVYVLWKKVDVFSDYMSARSTVMPVTPVHIFLLFQISGVYVYDMVSMCMI